MAVGCKYWGKGGDADADDALKATGGDFCQLASQDRQFQKNDLVFMPVFEVCIILLQGVSGGGGRASEGSGRNISTCHFPHHGGSLKQHIHSFLPCLL